MINVSYLYNIIFGVTLFSFFLAAVIGVVKYARLPFAMKFIVIGLVISLVSETCSFILVNLQKYHERYTLYHFYDVIESFITTAYFIYAIKSGNKRMLMVINAIAWPLIGFLNIRFFQPLGTMNTNMLMVESFTFITLSLYSVYQLIKDDEVDNVFKYPYFWMALMILITWSSSFFFWALVSFLFLKKWEYRALAMYVQTGLEILVNMATAIILLRFNKKGIINDKN